MVRPHPLGRELFLLRRASGVRPDPLGPPGAPIARTALTPASRKDYFSANARRVAVFQHTHGVFAKMYGKERRRGLSQARRAAYIFRLHLLCNGYAPPLGRES